jgi:hypothetical protein
MEHPCRLLMIEEFVLVDVSKNQPAGAPASAEDTKKKQYVCELQGDDSELVENRVANSYLTVDIDEPDLVVVVLEQQQHLISTGDVTLFAKGTTVEGGKLVFSKDEKIIYGKIKNKKDDNDEDAKKKKNDEDRHHRHLAINNGRTGVHEIVVLRVLVTDVTIGSPTSINKSDRPIRVPNSATVPLERMEMPLP